MGPVVEPPRRDAAEEPRRDAVEHDRVLARLREEIRRIERRPGRRDGVVPCGLAAVDGVLPGGGFPRGALSDLAGGPASGKTAVAIGLLAGLAADDLAAWVDARGELYPPAAAGRGVDLRRLLIVRPGLVLSRASGDGAERDPGAAPPDWRSALWASEALLASGAFAAVVIDAGAPQAIRGADAVARRLQGAAERGGAVGLWLGLGARGLRVPAAVRVELATVDGRVVARRPDVPGAVAAGGALRSGGGRAA
jgi:protein ImuA